MCLTAIATFSVNISPLKTGTGLPFSHGIEISPEDYCADSYIKYNCAFTTASAPLTFTNRNNSSSGTIRTGGHCMRLLQKTNPGIVVRDGKVTGIAPVRSFMLVADNFPSGVHSNAHCFIRLRKLVI